MKKLLVLFGSLMLIVVLAACGGGEEASSGSGDGSDNTVVLEAKNFEFDKAEYTVPAGKVTVELKSLEGHHGVIIEGTDIAIDGEGRATDTLEAGEYTIHCSVPCGAGHADMTAKLIVE
jgi:cytochrome c oxidase subunit 2